MRVLFVRCFGIGNAVMAVPAIKAMAASGHRVDVLVGGGPDDVGAFQVMERLREHVPGVVSGVHVDRVPLEHVYDVAVLSIPFDGRWTNGRDFSARMVVDGRSRPDPSTTGLSSWLRHESEYQMDNARSLGYSGADPDTYFTLSPKRREWKRAYLGLGYKKDQAGFWAKKHWGNENFSELASALRSRGYDVVTSGDPRDVVMSVAPIVRMSRGAVSLVPTPTLDDAFSVVGGCGLYVGNDTGMMHVAASMGVTTVGIFLLENSVIKSRPLGTDCHVIDGAGRRVATDEVLSLIERVH